MAGLFELEKRLKAKLALVRPVITEQDLQDLEDFDKEVNAYVGSMTYDVVLRMHSNLAKYNTMYIQAVGKRVINNQMDRHLKVTEDELHVQYNKRAETILQLLTTRLSLALF